jgi:hypothetical protein
VTVKLYTDKNTTATATPSAKIPVENNGHRFGLQSISGRIFELEVSSTASGTIYQIELELEDFE